MYIETSKAMQIITINKQKRIYVFRIQSNIYDGVFLRKQLTFIIFSERLHRRCSTGLSICFWKEFCKIAVIKEASQKAWKTPEKKNY